MLAADLLTTEQLAASLQISARQVQRLTLAGMPSVPVGARSRRYDAAECRAWLREQGESACRPIARPPAGGMSLSASAVDAYTAACRRAHLRVTPSASSPS